MSHNYFFKKKVIRDNNSFIRAFYSIPINFILPIFIISTFGIATLYSAANGSFEPFVKKHLFNLIISFIILLISSSFSLKFIYKISYLSYLIALILLIVVEFLGYKAMGATRWINLYFIKFQPSDLMKISLTLALARYFHDLEIKQIFKIKSLLLPSLMTLIPVLLVLRQPDLGTAIVLLSIMLIIFFLSGVKIWKFITALTFALCASPFIWNNLHIYQKRRILNFLNPEYDPSGSGYNIIQSKIAIGSGGLFGKGFVQGTQNQLSFLPEKHTDFIFTMFAEEWGFLGCIVILSLYFYIIFKGIQYSFNCKSQFSRITSYALTTLFFVHITINIFMVSGLIPVVGAPLPLMSYGGTIMLTTYLSLGIIISCYINRRININNALNNFF